MNTKHGIIPNERKIKGLKNCAHRANPVNQLETACTGKKKQNKTRTTTTTTKTPPNLLIGFVSKWVESTSLNERPFIMYL